jgi:hypothetical protein
MNVETEFYGCANAMIISRGFFPAIRKNFAGWFLALDFVCELAGREWMKKR